MSKIKNGGLDQNGAEPFEQQQFGTAGVEGMYMVAKLHLQTLSKNLSAAAEEKSRRVKEAFPMDACSAQ